MHPTPANHNPVPYVAAIDGLRCLAVLWVLVHNAGNVMLGAEQNEVIAIKVFDLIVSMGWLGVQLFFVISGYLVTLILIRSRSSSRGLSRFMMRRVLRIFPVYFLFLAVMVGLAATTVRGSEWLSDLHSEQAWYWTYSVNWMMPFSPSVTLPHLWSLAVEEQFYLVWPFVVLFLPTRLLAPVFITVIVVATLTRSGLLLSATGDWEAEAAYVWTICRFDALAAGGLLALAASRNSDLPVVLLQRLFWLGVFGLLLIVAITHQFAAKADGIALLNQSIACLLFIGMLGITVAGASPWTSWLGSPILVYIGRISYAMYLFHLPVFKFWFAWDLIPVGDLVGLPRLWVMLANIAAISAITAGLASLSWYAFERPILNLKRRIPYFAP